MKSKQTNPIPRRILLQIQILHEEFNAAARDGSAAQKLGKIPEDAKPEAVYFTQQDGYRGVIMVVNLNNESKIPKYAEPWFLTFNADIQFKNSYDPGRSTKCRIG